MASPPYQRHAVNGADPALQAYMAEHGARETPAQRALRAESASHPRAGVQVAPEQAQFLALLVRLLGARRVVEVGTFCGYSALTMALALPEGGELVLLLHGFPQFADSWAGFSSLDYDGPDPSIGILSDITMVNFVDGNTLASAYVYPNYDTPGGGNILWVWQNYN